MKRAIITGLGEVTPYGASIFRAYEFRRMAQVQYPSLQLKFKQFELLSI